MTNIVKAQATGKTMPCAIRLCPLSVSGPDLSALEPRFCLAAASGFFSVTR